MDTQIQYAPTAVNPGISSGLAGTGKTSGSGNDIAGFGDALAALLGTGQADPSSDGDLSLEALLAGMFPALFNLMPAQQTASDTLQGTASEQMISAAAGQPALLDSLMNGKSMQQWLSQASELLAAFGFGQPDRGTVPVQTVPSAQQEDATPSASGPATFTVIQAQAILQNLPTAVMATMPVQTVPSAQQEDATPSTGGPATFTVIQAQAILQNLLTAVKENPQSVLLQQLMTGFRDMLAPEVTAQAAAGQINSAGPAKKDDNGARAEMPISWRSAGTVKNAGTAGKSEESPAAVDAQPTKLAASFGVQRAAALNMMQAKLSWTPGNPVPAAEDALASTAKTDQLAADPVPFLNGELTRTAAHPMSKESVPVSAQNFVQDMSRFILKNVKVDSLNGISEARLTLTPEHLGQVDVKISVHNGQLVAHFAAQTALGKELLESQLPQLRTTLSQQGLQVDRLEVTQSGGMPSGMFQDQRQHQTSQQFARRFKSGNGDYARITDEFAGEMLQAAGQVRYGDEERFDVTA